MPSCSSPPAPTIARLSAAAKKALESKEVREQIYTSGMAPDYLDASGYGGLLKKLTATRTALVKEMGITGK